MDLCNATVTHMIVYLHDGHKLWFMFHRLLFIMEGSEYRYFEEKPPVVHEQFMK